jgi:Flp pilus assembly protein TadD
MRRLPAVVPIMILFPLGLAECRAQSATAETLGPPILPANTPVILRLKKNLYKKDAKPGQPVEFEVSLDVVVNGQIFIPSGAAVTGSLRQVDKTGKGPAKVLIDFGPAQTVSGEMVRLIGPGTTKDDPSPGDDRPRLKDLPGMVAWGPELMGVLPVVVPVLAVMELFLGKKVLLHKDTGCGWFGDECGVWVVAHVAEDVALDPAKLKPEPEQAPSSEVLKGGLVFLRLLLMPDPRANGRFRSLVLTGDHLHRAGDLDGAIQEYQQALAMGAGSWDVQFSLAQVFEEKRDFVHALPEYQRAVQLKPDDEHARERFVSFLVESGDPDVALAEIKEGMRMWPNNIFFQYLLGKVLVKKNDPDGAIAELQWVLKQEKNHDWKASCALGGAYERKGDPKAALGQYRTAYRVHMDDKECRAAYERLHSQLKR